MFDPAIFDSAIFDTGQPPRVIFSGPTPADDRTTQRGKRWYRKVGTLGGKYE